MTAPRQAARVVVVVASCAALGACTSHHIELEPIEIKPIHITVDVNLKVQRQLDEFFAFEEQVDPDARARVPEPARTTPDHEGRKE